MSFQAKRVLLFSFSTEKSFFPTSPLDHFGKLKNSKKTFSLVQTLLSFSLQHLLSFIFSSSFFPPPTAFDYHHHHHHRHRHHHRHFPAPNLATPLSRLILILSPAPETFAPPVQFLWSSPLPLLQLCTASLTVHQCVLVVNSCGFNSFHHLCHYHISFTTTTNKYVSSPFPQPIVLFHISSFALSAKINQLFYRT